MQTLQHGRPAAVVALLAVAACASAFPGYSQSSSHVSASLGAGDYSAGGGGYEQHEEHYAHPEYKYEYAVHDPHTGDVKSQSETRHGDAVKGSYTVHDADGHVRTVEYQADKHSGFQAVVKKGGKVTLHGFGEQDEQNNAVGHSASQGHSASYSQAINHGYNYGKGVGGGAGAGGGYGGAGLGGHAQVTFEGHGHGGF